MRHFLTTGIVIAMTGVMGTAHAADTNLIFNKDTGAQVRLNSNDNVVGTRNPDPEDNNGYQGGNVSADAGVNTRIETDSGIEGDATSGGVLVQNDADAHVGTESDADAQAQGETRVELNTQDAVDDVRGRVGETREEIDARIEDAEGEAGERVQDLQGQTESGVRATATTEIDVQ